MQFPQSRSASHFVIFKDFNLDLNETNTIETVS
jgi:hypothetical protein